MIFCCLILYFLSLIAFLPVLCFFYAEYSLFVSAGAPATGIMHLVVLCSSFVVPLNKLNVGEMYEKHKLGTAPYS